VSRGYSGRIVLEIDPATKNDLYVALAKKKLTLKDWFLNECLHFIEETNQPSLFSEKAAEATPSYGDASK
jgi:hypothetical protein